MALTAKNAAMQLSDKQVSAIALETQGFKTLEICRELSIGSATLTAWRKSPAYKTGLVIACQQSFARLVPKAINGLERILDDPATPPMAVVRAADLILKGAALITGTSPADGVKPDDDGEGQVSGVVRIPAKRPVQSNDAPIVRTLATTHAPVTMSSD